MKQQIIIIVGPNASGKTSLSLKIAKKMNGEIISADSRQVYRGLNIGSGKVTKKEMRGVPHHCLSIANPKKVFTALDFKNCAEKAIADILSRGKTPIIVGGTGFYIDAVLGRMKLGGVPPNPKLRKKLSHYSLAKLNTTLAKLDPERARTVEQKNPVRLIRAIEMALAPHTPAPLPLRRRGGLRGGEVKEKLRESLAQRDGASRAIRQQANMRASEKHDPLPKVTWLGIKRKPEELKKRLFKLGLEYRYVSLYLRDKLDYKLMTIQLETAIWHYAKRQMTWFKKNKDIRWINNPKSISSISL